MNTTGTGISKLPRGPCSVSRPRRRCFDSSPDHRRQRRGHGRAATTRACPQDQPANNRAGPHQRTPGPMAPHGMASCGTFQPLERSGVTLPQTTVVDGVVGFLDALNTPNYDRGVSLDRTYDVLILGWIASRHAKVDAEFPDCVPAHRPRSGDRYFAEVRSRVRRDDVLSHLKAQRAYRRMSRDVLALQRVPRLLQHRGSPTGLVQARRIRPHE